MTTINTKTDDILLNLNRIHDSKETGALTGFEFSDELKRLAPLFSNKIAKGEMTEEEATDVYSEFLSQFETKNKDKFFNFKHEGLDSAASLYREEINVALLNKEQTGSYTR